jgi:hypothetical protein
MALNPTEFQYATPQVNPYAASIAELMLRQGDIQAQGATRIGDIAAQKAQQLGQIFGNEAQQIGQGAAGAAQAIGQAKGPQGQITAEQLQALKLENAKREADLAQTRQTMKTLDLIAQNPEKRDALIGTLPPAMQKQLADTDKAHADAVVAHGKAVDSIADSFGAAGAFVREHGYDPLAAQGQLSSLKQAWAGNPDVLKQIQQIEQKIQTNPTADAIKPIADGLISQSKTQRKMDLDAAAAAETKRANLAREARPVVIGPGASAFSPQLPIPGGSLQSIATVPAKPTAPKVSAEFVTKDDKPILMNDKGQFFANADDLVAGTPLAPSQMKMKPPASVIVQQANAAAQANAPAISAERPTGPNANKVDPRTGLTPNGMYQAAVANALQGTMPQMGFGQGGVAMAVREGVVNTAGALAASAGTDLPTLRAEYRANAGTLSKLLPQATATANASNTAADNLDLAVSKSADVARTGAKLVNRYAQWAQGELTPAKGLSEFETYIYTAAREYAKVTSGGAASSQGLTDSAAREATKLLSAAQAPETFAAVAQAMKNDMGNVTAEQANGLAKVSQTISDFFKVAHGLPASSTQVKTPPPAAATAPPTGKMPAAQKGEQRMFPDGPKTWDGTQWVKQ